MPLSRDDVAHIASLVRLGMSEDEIETLRAELSDILAQFETLSAVDTTDVPPTAHPGGMRNIFDDDEPASSLDAEAVLSNAPLREDGFFRVKAVLEE